MSLKLSLFFLPEPCHFHFSSENIYSIPAWVNYMCKWTASVWVNCICVSELCVNELYVRVNCICWVNNILMSELNSISFKIVKITLYSICVKVCVHYACDIAFFPPPQLQVDNPLFHVAKQSESIRSNKEYRIVVSFDGADSHSKAAVMGKLIVSCLYSAGGTSNVQWMYYLKGV